MNTNGIYILSIERVNPDNAGWFDGLDERCTQWLDANYAYNVIVNFYGKEKNYTIALYDSDNFRLFNDILLKALNVVMIDTDRRELEQMFYNANQWYSYITPKVYC